MPVPSLNRLSIEVVMHRTSDEFLRAAWPWLSKRESAANTILPFALETLALESASLNSAVGAGARLCPGPPYLSGIGRARSKAVQTISRSDSFWLTCWSKQEPDTSTLDLVLSCTDGPLGESPIFLHSILPPTELNRAFLDPRVAMLVNYLLSIIPLTRVFSTFGPTLLVNNFSRQWSAITGVKQECEPFYAATFSYAARQTLTAATPLPSGDCMRRATPDDVPAIGQLCKEFADGSVYYHLTHEQSLREATELVLNRQIWVYETCGRQIASIVAVTRTSPNIAAITKVYTGLAWRRRGCAERLVRKVTNELLYGAGKERVVLYVSHGNPAAKVYARVGFVGLERNEILGGLEEWLEIGFRGTSRGHW